MTVNHILTKRLSYHNPRTENLGQSYMRSAANRPNERGSKIGSLRVVSLCQVILCIAVQLRSTFICAHRLGQIKIVIIPFYMQTL